MTNNFTIGLSLLLNVASILAGITVTQLRTLWNNQITAINRLTRIGYAIIFTVIIACLGMYIVTMLFVGYLFITTPDLPNAQPLNVTLNISTSTGVINTTSFSCTPTYSCPPPIQCPSQKECPEINVSLLTTCSEIIQRSKLSLSSESTISPFTISSPNCMSHRNTDGIVRLYTIVRENGRD